MPKTDRFKAQLLQPGHAHPELVMPRKAVDAGCGPALLLGSFLLDRYNQSQHHAGKSRGPEWVSLTGIDVAPEFVRRARSFPN